MDCPEKLKPHLNHSLELDHKVEGGHVVVKVFCCECGEDVGVLYEGPDISERLWEVRLKLSNVWLRQLPAGAKPGDLVSVKIFAEAEELRGEAKIISIEEQNGKNFVCAGCGQISPASRGADDDLPYHCDECWAKEHPEKAGRIEEEFLEALQDREEWAVNLVREMVKKYGRKR